MQVQRGWYVVGYFGLEVSFGWEMVKVGYYLVIFKYCLGVIGFKCDWKVLGIGGIYDEMIEKFKLVIENLEQEGYCVNICGFVWI